MTRMKTSAVIPIKQLENAKQRLSDSLSSSERRALFTAMVEDVLTAVEACTLIDQIVVVTDDDAVASLAGAYGAVIWPEPDSPGLIEAVTAAGERLAEEGFDCMVFLPGDVPLVTVDELEVVLTGFGGRNHSEMLIVPASDLGGSNCLAVSPPDCMTFGFGTDSFRRHLRIARDKGLDPQVAKLPGLGLDIDTPGDLRELLTYLAAQRQDGLEYNTVRYLIESGIGDRMKDERARAD